VTKRAERRVPYRCSGSKRGGERGEKRVPCGHVSHWICSSGRAHIVLHGGVTPRVGPGRGKRPRRTPPVHARRGRGCGSRSARTQPRGSRQEGGRAACREKYTGEFRAWFWVDHFSVEWLELFQAERSAAGRLSGFGARTRQRQPSPKELPLPLGRARTAMHPPLTLDDHPLCRAVVIALKRCHRDNPWARSWGVCNTQKEDLDVCLKKQK